MFALSGNISEKGWAYTETMKKEVRQTSLSIGYQENSR